MSERAYDILVKHIHDTALPHEKVLIFSPISEENLEALRSLRRMARLIRDEGEVLPYDRKIIDIAADTRPGEGMVHLRCILTQETLSEKFKLVAADLFLTRMEELGDVPTEVNHG